jgi:hypothetical protein
MSPHINAEARPAEVALLLLKLLGEERVDLIEGSLRPRRCLPQAP